MAKQKTIISSGNIKREIVDDDGDVIGYYEINPTDLKIMKRAEEVGDFFENFGNSRPKGQELTIDILLELNNELEGKIDYVLGKGASDSLFQRVSAVSYDDNGVFFVEKVFDVIYADLNMNLEKRSKVMSDRVKKYTKGYNNNKNKNRRKR